MQTATQEKPAPETVDVGDLIVGEGCLWRVLRLTELRIYVTEKVHAAFFVAGLGHPKGTETSGYYFDRIGQFLVVPDVEAFQAIARLGNEAEGRCRTLKEHIKIIRREARELANKHGRLAGA